MKTFYASGVVRVLRSRALLAIMSFMMLASVQTFASHMAGSDLTYRYIGNNRYVVRFTLYRDCSGITAPTQEFLSLSSFSCNGFDTTYTLNALPGTGHEITYTCGSATTTCAGGTSPGIQEYVYEDTIQMPAQCPDWKLSVSDCCRNQAITTIQNASGANLYIESFLNNMTYDHSSPTFSNVPVAFECIGQTNFYNHGGIDPNGDSLVYVLVPPLNGPNDPLSYNAGYSIANPLSSNPPISINQATGDIQIHPTQVEVGVVAVQIMEYRNGLLIGSVMRDIQVYTVACSNTLPTATGINGTTSFQTTSCAGGQFCFDIVSDDTDPHDTLVMTWNNGIPAGTFTTTAGPHPVGTFCWTPTAADARSQPYTFTVTIRDNACPSNGVQTYSYSIHVSGLNVSVNSTPGVACHGDLTGTASVQAAGLPPLHYHWSNQATTATVSGLAAGTYTVTVTDGGGCVGTRSFTITEPTALTATNTVIAAGCAGNQGSITVHPSGGSGNYQYIWPNQVSTGPTATGLAPGNYTITVLDAHSCQTTTTATVTSAVPITLTTSATNVSCFGGHDGSATVTASGGGGTLTYVWTPNVSTGSTANNLGAATYNILVSNGTCSATTTVTITSPTAVAASMTSTPAHCSDSSGTATVSASGGTGSFTYAWTPNVSSGSAATGLSSGSYGVVVTDANGCTAAASTLVSSSGFTVNVTTTPATCQGSEDGSATATASGGVSPYTYLWNPTGGTTASINNLASGTYTVGVTDYLGCRVYATGNVGFVHAAPLVDLGNDTSICFGNTLTLDAGAGANRTYLWSDNSTGQTLTVSGPGAYSVLVTDANGCQGSDDIVVTFIQCFRPVPNANIIHHGNPPVLSVFPNPASTSLQISIGHLKDAEVRITLCDILGNKIYSSQEYVETGYIKSIDIHQYAAGIYLLKVEYAGELNTIRVVKQ